MAQFDYTKKNIDPLGLKDLMQPDNIQPKTQFVDYVKQSQQIEINAVAEEVKEELTTAMETHGPMTSYHEAYAVILEEVDEFWDEVKKKKPDPERCHEELIQIAAMAMRALIDVC